MPSPGPTQLMNPNKHNYYRVDVSHISGAAYPRLTQPQYGQATPLISAPRVPIIRIPSTHSAFRSPHEAPPLPPKSSAVRVRAIRLSARSTSDSPPPLPPRKDAPPTNYAPGWTPIPKPRLSKMKSMVNLCVPEVPTPKPRRKTSEYDDTVTFPNAFDSAVKRSSTKSTASISSRCSVASVKRRNGAHRPATPVINREEEPTAKPIIDESERMYLEAAVRQTYSGDTSDSEDSNCSAPYTRMIRFPRKTPSLPSPTTDSGLPHSDDEDKRTPCSAKSEDDGFFDASGVRRESDESESERLTSISNQIPVELEKKEEERGNGLSMLEKNARVMRWIHQTSM